MSATSGIHLSQGVNTKADFELAAEVLYQIELVIREKTKEKNELRERMLPYLKKVPGNYITDRFIIEKGTNVKYGVPTPDRLRAILGVDAEHYISEQVDPEVRLHLGPKLAEVECPKLRETEFVKLVIQEGK